MDDALQEAADAKKARWAKHLARCKRDADRYVAKCARADAMEESARLAAGLPTREEERLAEIAAVVAEANGPVVEAAPADLPGLDDDAPAELPPLFVEKPTMDPVFGAFSWSNKSAEELRIYVPVDPTDGALSVKHAADPTGVKHAGNPDTIGVRTSVDGDVSCVVTVKNWSQIELRIDVAFPGGTRRLEIPRLYAKAKYTKTIVKKNKLIFCMKKLDTWGVEWPSSASVNMWPQIYWDTKFGMETS